MQTFRRPASGAIAGLVFGGILITVMVLLRTALPPSGSPATTWVDVAEQRDAVELALNLIPFAGIAFLWFMAVIRARLGSAEDRFFETVFLGSGLIFVALLFTSAAAVKSALVLTDTGVGLPRDLAAFAWTFSSIALDSFALRMAAVFTISVASMGRRTGTVPRWLAITGYLVGILLLVSPLLPNLTQFLFPGWVVLISIYILVGRGRTPESPGPATGSAAPPQGQLP